MKRILALLLAVVMCLALFTGCSSSGSGQASGKEEPKAEGTAQEDVQEEGADSDASGAKVIRLAASDSADYPLCKADTLFQEKMGELSGGTVEVQTFFDGILGEESDTVESCKLGMLELTRVSAGNMVTFVPELALFNLPFLFKDKEHFNAVIDGEVGEIYQELFENAGLKLIALYDEGTRNIFTINGPVATPDDLKGLKIRTMGAQSIQDGFTAMGASPTPMNSGEVFTSLSQGLLDACENNYSSVYTLRWFETAKYFSNTEHLRVPSVLCCSLDYWNSLTEEEQGWILDAAAQAKAYASEIFDDGEKEAFDNLIKAGCVYTELTAEQRNAFAEKCSDVYQKYATTDEAVKILDIINELGA